MLKERSYESYQKLLNGYKRQIIKWHQQKLNAQKITRLFEQKYFAVIPTKYFKRFLNEIKK